MDAIDLRIISELSEDARRPFRKIGQKIGVSTQTVIKRFNELKKNGTIQICSISVDANKIGYEGMAHLLLKGSPGKSLPAAIERLKKTENIVIATRAVGDYEGYAILAFKNAKDLYERARQISLMPEVEDIELCFTTPVPMGIPPINRAVRFR